MKKVVLSMLAIAMMTAPAIADGYNFEAGYTMLGGDESDVSIDLGGIYGVVGYEWNHAGNYSSGAEALVVIGLQDDDIFGVDVSLDPSIEVAYRGTWYTSTPDFNVFWRASYARVGIEVSGFGATESADENGFGLGAGASWRGFTLGYTQYMGDLSDFNRFNIGYRFKTK